MHLFMHAHNPSVYRIGSVFQNKILFRSDRTKFRPKLSSSARNWRTFNELPFQRGHPSCMTNVLTNKLYNICFIKQIAWQLKWPNGVMILMMCWCDVTVGVNFRKITSHRRCDAVFFFLTSTLSCTLWIGWPRWSESSSKVRQFDADEFNFGRNSVPSDRNKTLCWKTDPIR